MKNVSLLFLLLILFVSVSQAEPRSINPYIDSLNPGQNAINVSRTSYIRIYFSQSMSFSTLSTGIEIYGMQTGLLAFGVGYTEPSHIATLSCTGNFKPNELISVSITSAVKTSGGTSVTPFVYTFTANSAPGPMTFSQYAVITAGGAPECASPGDFNHDGKMDFAVTNLNSGSASIIKNNGSGSFSVTQTLTTGTQPRLAVSGDFDMDGDLDLAVINHTANTINILANDGLGNFSLITTIDNPGGPFSITTCDLDGDGDLDLAVANYLSGTVGVYKNNGTGGFSYPVLYTVDTGPVCVDYGDVNNDGDLDLAVTSWNAGTLTVLNNDGNGNIFSQNIYSVYIHPHSVVLADIDNDHDLDMIVANNGTTLLSIYKNNGSGTFTSFPAPSCGATGVSLATGDLDGDGDLDLAYSNNALGVSFLLNDGVGNYSLLNSTSTTTGPRRIALIDVDGDNVLDLVVPNTDLNNILVFRNGYTPPPAPTLVSPTNGSNEVSTSTAFVWYHITGVTSYKIQISTSSDFLNIVDSATTATNQYLPPSGKLVHSTTYYWRVRATNAYGTGPWSAVWYFRTVMYPAAPSLISPANNTSGVALTPTLYWGMMGGITGFRVQVSLSSSFANIVDESVTPNNYYVVPSGKLIPATTYYWRVNATNANGTGPWSVVWNFTTTVTGINQIGSAIPDKYFLYVNYPNPFNPETKIKFDLPENTRVNLAVFDVSGRNVHILINQNLNPGTYEVAFDGSGLSSGIYYYRFVSDKYVSVKKMVLVK